MRRLTVGAAMALVTLVGCSGQGAQQSVSSTASTQTSTASSTSTAPVRTTQAALPVSGDGADLHLNPVALYAGCTPGFVHTTTWPDNTTFGQLFNAKTGTNSRFPAPTLAAGDALVGYACTVTATDAGQLRIVYFITARTPSHGLTEESTHTDIVVMDPASNTPLQTKPYTGPYLDGAGQQMVMYTVAHGFAVGKLIENDIVALTIYDADGNTRRTVTGVNAGPTLDAIWLCYDGYAIYQNGSGLHFYDFNGADVGMLSDASGPRRVDHGFLVERNISSNPSPDIQPGLYYFDMRSKKSTGPIAPYIDYNPAGEGFAQLPSDRTIYGERILLKGTRGGEGKYLKVFDTSEMRVLLDLPAEKLDGLKIDLDNTSIGGDFLYITNASDNPVINFLNSEQVSSGWKLRPVAPVPEGWVIVLPDEPGSDLEMSAANLRRGQNGAYDGPWF
ncbi:hypothetical protein [Mycolicibacterium vinylchloridicum]|uniref:hypothetical protein n=1 Tax=Mycolicibacterium vinylchloridicum TaxID=2736928 RepID=UPI0015CA102C|nr:hypothetical protein [Mycolicibacterium vinylchloridicum]